MKTNFKYHQIRLTDVNDLDHIESPTKGAKTRHIVDAIDAAEVPVCLTYCATVTDVEEIVEMWLAMTYFIKKALDPNDPDILIESLSRTLHQAYACGALNAHVPELVIEIAYDETPIAWSISVKIETTEEILPGILLHEEAFLSKY